MAELTREGRRKIVLWVVGLGSLLAIVLGVTVWWTVLTTQKDAREIHLPIPVQTLPARVESLEETIGGSGSIQPSTPVNLYCKVVARVLRITVDEGAIVHPGDLLVELDPSLYIANLASAQASYDHDHNQLMRLEALARRHFASATDVENAKVAEAQAWDSVVSAKIDLSNTKVLSPAPAVVLSRSVNPGEMSKMDETLMQLGIMDPVDMDASLTEDKMGYVYLGMPGEVGTDAFPGELFKGTVAKMDPTIDPATRTFGAYVRMPNPGLRLKKGVTGYARLMSRRMALVVPSTAILNPLGDKATVFVVGDDGRARAREVRTGLVLSGNMTEILAGLREGEQVVVIGQFELHDNDLVRANEHAPWNHS
ncbi:MAG TPA: efflux RND transporter periplasmic adaptor subunit [Candidatus Binataceae bacterium]|nr:efflux RND transporter periplasmic adaptor subunit [Candidatus Binataceae bacterium]